MSFRKLQTARAVFGDIDSPILPRHNHRLEAAFYAHMGLRYDQATRQLTHNWRVAMGERHSHNTWVDVECEDVRAAALARFTELIDSIYEFATANNIRPRLAVLDRIIRTHHFRNARENGSTLRGIGYLFR